MKKEPRFFCDNCGTEVARDTDTCSRCGRFFSSVRCPQCGFSADEDLFKNGCPQCGYSASSARKIRSEKPHSSKKKNPEGKLPFWVYVFSISAFIFAFAMLFLRACR